MADTICKSRSALPVRVNWANTFIKRTLALMVKLGRTYKCQRRLCEDPQIIGAWFGLVRNTINKYPMRRHSGHPHFLTFLGMRPLTNYTDFWFACLLSPVPRDPRR